ncbi:MAG: phenylalanine--tRNA ligase subunit alpha [Clostridia bacterium]|nr:phenylalanine--tRNA ligase subunit alpha [Clostridia bacterium]
MQEKIEQLKQEITEKFANVKNMQELQDLKVLYMGKKGIITELNNGIKDVAPEEKKEYGMLVNSVRTLFNDSFQAMQNKLQEELINEKLKKDTIDISLPSKKIKRGSKHPLNRVIEEVEDLFVSMGYDVYDGPELEDDEHCFRLLNYYVGHPARDAQDTFYIDDEYLLRTQTSASQSRVMQENKEKTPIRIICPGKTYRRDDDATHSHQFSQVEGLVIDEGISLADLKRTLEILAKKLLGNDTQIRFRPSYFPFTEPSCEVDVTCFKCGGHGCNLCKQTGWIELLGAGMVHPNVLRMSGYDPEKYTGFAFGTGLDRLAMFKYAIPDIRLLYTNDIRFLEQFDRKDEENEIKY